MRCLRDRQKLRNKKGQVYSFAPIMAPGTLNEHEPGLIRLPGELVRAALAAIVCGTSKCHGEFRDNRLGQRLRASRRELRCRVPRRP
jgi:hypothetical protein